MKRKRTKHKGIYKVGGTYYISYYVGSKKYEKAAGKKLSLALSEKIERERSGKRGTHEVIERQEKTKFSKLAELYEKEGDGKKFILQFIPAYLKHFGDWRLSEITRKDLFKFRDGLKATPKQRGGSSYTLKCKCGKIFEQTSKKCLCPNCSNLESHKVVRREARQIEVTDSTVNRAMAGLRRLFNFAVLREYMVDNPFPKISKSGLFYSNQQGLRNFFTEDQMEKIVNASPDWLRPLILTAYYTGMREGELLGLRWEWVDLKDGVIYLPSTKTLKDLTGRGQKVVMQRELVDLFKGLPDRSECVFCQPGGEPFKQWHIYKPFKEVLKSLGIDIKRFSWKELRHTTASLLNRKGVRSIAIKDQLRHSTVKTTENFYIGSDIEYQREQIEKLILNSGKIVGNDQIAETAQLPTA